MITTAAFDCFGTIFDMSNFPKHEIADYVAHVKRNDFTEYAFNGPWWELKAFPDVKEGLEVLDSIGICCYAFSNGRKRLLETLFENNNLTFTDVWDPTEHNVYKPHPAAYPAFCDWVGANPANCLMVTANPTFGDVEGAAVIGMKPWVIRHGRMRDVGSLAEHFVMIKKLEAAIESMRDGGSQP
jgi:HAD superfamily hydrolase (TIGR01493 family)